MSKGIDITTQMKCQCKVGASSLQVSERALISGISLQKCISMQGLLGSLLSYQNCTVKALEDVCSLTSCPFLLLWYAFLQFPRYWKGHLLCTCSTGSFVEDRHLVIFLPMQVTGTSCLPLCLCHMPRRHPCAEHHPNSPSAWQELPLVAATPIQ